jgi:hypothetical protein
MKPAKVIHPLRNRINSTDSHHHHRHKSNTKEVHFLEYDIKKESGEINVVGAVQK